MAFKRLLTVFILFFLGDFQLYQIGALFALNLSAIIYTIIIRPLEIRINNYLKILAEFSLLGTLALIGYNEYIN